jgi:pimeloyl-ACP methyl ester carboxylesterase
VVERTGEVAGLPTHWREAPSEGRPAVLYVHGVPTASWDWIPYLERIGGIAPDLPGFGRSAKPADFDYSISGYAAWLETFIDSVGLDRFSLVVHDFGGAFGLALAQTIPERIERLVIHTAAPLLPGYRWHRVARAWRTPGLGELFMATASKPAFRLISRESNATPGPLPDEFIDRFWPDFDRGTRRAILRLYRASSPDVFARAGERLAAIDCPTLILWPTDDPYAGPEWGTRYAEAIGANAGLEMIERAGHWMWLDRPDVIDKAAAFLSPWSRPPVARKSSPPRR